MSIYNIYCQCNLIIYTYGVILSTYTENNTEYKLFIAFLAIRL